MELRPLLSLLRNLLDICRQCARRSLHWLLRLLSAVSPRLLNASRFVGQDSDKGRYESKQPSDLTSGRQDGHDNAPRQPVVFMACSTTPKRPPPARSRTRHTSYESYHIGPTCSSPTSTLRQASDTLFPSLKSPKSLTSCLSEEDGNVTDEFHAPSGERFAEPASVVAHPDKQFKTILPSQSSRYDRNVPIKNDLGPWVFGPFETLTVYDELDIPGWRLYIQPEGQPYFLSDRKFRYLTEENLDDSLKLAEAERFIEAFERRTENYKVPASNVEIVFELHRGHWSYYMVDVSNRRLFWIDDCIIDDLVLPLDFGVEHREHFRKLLEFEYWQHIEYFPNHHPMPAGLLDELLALLIQQHIDVETSLTSTAGFEPYELKSMIGSVKKLRSLQTSDHVLPYIVHVSARMMGLLANDRFFNFYGFYGARLSPFQTVREGDPQRNRSLLITLLSPILFYAPEVHLSALEKVWVDNVMKWRHWKKFQDKIEKDWEQFILYATVLVNANVAFLAIPNVISDDLGPGLLTSPASAVSQISIMTSLGSIIIGLLLVRQVRSGSRDTCEDYITYLENCRHPRLGLETLSILYSLPYALLIWGMSTFLAAIAISCFYDMGGDITVVKRVIYSVVWAFLLAFIAWTIQMGWEKNAGRSSPAPSYAAHRNSETGSPVNSNPVSVLGSFFGRARKKPHSNPGPILLNDSITEEVEFDAMDSDARSGRSCRSSRSVRSRLTVSSTVVPSIKGSWRQRSPRNRAGAPGMPKPSGFSPLSWLWRGRSTPADVNHGGLPHFETRSAA